MSSYRFCDNTETPLFNAAVSGTSPVMAGGTSNPIKVIDWQTYTFQAEWDGTLSGVLVVLGSLDGVNYRQFGASVGTQPAGTPNGVLIPLYGHGMKFLALQYTNASGSGHLTITGLGKTR